ncbi:DNA mismatch repair protein MutL [Hathewaya proteolytica DSM 3090]|uniref:DNA mismatch repair protein MutL n=1 Tax=Hathewaya proteolytica DSM 3090 TaxID=1121331 RepID=A0A1M6J373_9CLOT|nr:DNA mismatch repair endonuclease MutL [Hathewaya proteolytica]SHJ41138.1 DNA mismatch repair protein MutL [Hathewaya proteolytica DSM 3090]
MSKINLLSKETSNKIAAGEVVERPASVVKELIENSIDANSKNIEIRIEDGGQDLIFIKDDGMGMDEEDLKLAFLPHATSKICSIEDIYSISSLGFRGEALPSIASISNVVVQSRSQDSMSGHEIKMDAGQCTCFKEIGCAPGTIFEVRNLFFNVPARQKFLKSSNREAAVISEMVLKMALCNSHIGFTYFNNNKKVYSTSGSGDLLENIRVLYGKEVYENSYYFEGHNDIATVYGYIGNDKVSRGSRSRQTIFINKRLVKNQLISVAVENAFKSFLTINKYPFFTIFLEIYPELIDVNVHPSKSEVKIRDDKMIYKLVFDSVHSALRDNLKESFNIDFENDHNDENHKIVEKPVHEQKNFIEYVDKDTNFNSIQKLQERAYKAPVIESNHEVKEEQNYNYVNSKTETNIPMEILQAKFPKLKIIGQYNNTYIIGEAFGQLYLIDQHAAHEKIMFEKYINQISKHKVISQIVLVPVLCELSPSEYATYEENVSIFTDMGFKIEPFGDTTLSIREFPLLLGEVNCKKTFFSIIENLKTMGSGSQAEVNYNKIATIACKSAVKANNELSFEEMEFLIDELRFINDPFRCPHGRPTIIKFTLTDIEKMFKRIQ